MSPVAWSLTVVVSTRDLNSISPRVTGPDLSSSWLRGSPSCARGWGPRVDTDSLHCSSLVWKTEISVTVSWVWKSGHQAGRSRRTLSSRSAWLAGARPCLNWNSISSRYHTTPAFFPFFVGHITDAPETFQDLRHIPVPADSNLQLLLLQLLVI